MSTQSAEVGSALADLEAEYEFLDELGRGGMAVVYRARDRTLGREVAVKLIRARYADDQEVLARFAREARLAARLEHANVVRVYTVRHLANATLALVMEYVPGVTLKQEILRTGALPLDRAERVLRELASALACAHAHGIIHRDVKPDNIFIDRRDGRALLADFGIARPLAADAQLTVGGMAMGTPAYMAPEQIDGRPLDGRCDLYGLGLVGWEMLTGQAPWEGESFYSVLHKQKTAALPPLLELRPEAPARLRAAIEAVLHKEPAERLASAEEFLELLDSSSEPPWREWVRRAADGVRRVVPPSGSAVDREALDAPAGEVETVIYRRSSGVEAAEAAIEAATAGHAVETEAATAVEERTAWFRLPGLLRRVLEQNERVEITRGGRVVCALVPAEDVARLAAEDLRLAFEQRRLAEWHALRQALDCRTLAAASPNRHPRWELYPGAAEEFATLVEVTGLTASCARVLMAAYGSLAVLVADTAAGVERRTGGEIPCSAAERLLHRLRRAGLDCLPPEHLARADG